MKELLQSLAANKVVEIDSIPHKLVKLAAILLSGRTSNHAFVMYFHSSCYLISQSAPFYMLGRFLNTSQLERIALFQKSQEYLKMSYRENYL